MGHCAVHRYRRLVDGPASLARGADGCRRRRRILLTGWLFDWPMESVIATTIPCLIILALGYRRGLRAPSHRVLARCARSVALVGTIWLLVAAVFDVVTPLLHLGHVELYDAPSFWMDLRFYIGWTVGLALAPSPIASRDLPHSFRLARGGP